MRSFKPQDTNGGLHDITMDHLDETNPKHGSMVRKVTLKHNGLHLPKESNKNMDEDQ